MSAGTGNGDTRDPIVRTLAARRAELGVPQRDLADRIGTTQSHISYIESGRTGVSLDVVRRWADALGCELRVALADPGEVS